MRSAVLSALLILTAPALLAQTPPRRPVNAAVPTGGGDHPMPRPGPCCHEKVWDASGQEIGDLLDYDTRYGPQQLNGFVAYHIKGGDAVTLQVTPELINGLQSPGGSVALFTTPDCSGPNMFAMLAWPPLAKRYAMVLLVGPAGSIMWSATNAWLWVTDPLPVRAMPAPGTVFHSQWDSGACVPYPAPGYTVSGTFGGYWMHRVEDLYAKYKRPFYIDY
jgi:hypothetical protein